MAGSDDQAAGSAIRFANPENLEQYVSAAPRTKTIVSSDAALQESLFLGLRLNRGVSLSQLKQLFCESAIKNYIETLEELIAAGLLARKQDTVRLTQRGRLLSNEVFERFIFVPSA